MLDLCYEIYLQALNILYHVQSSGYWYCFCDRFDGCAISIFTSETIKRSVCKIDYDFDAYLLEKIKYEPEKMFSYVHKLVDELKKGVSIDRHMTDFWCDERITAATVCLMSWLKLNFQTKNITQKFYIL